MPMPEFLDKCEGVQMVFEGTSQICIQLEPPGVWTIAINSDGRWVRHATENDVDFATFGSFKEAFEYFLKHILV